MPRTNTIKTAISIPREEFEFIEAMRKKTGKSRSRILVEALHSWMAGRRTEELEDVYEAGYRKKPESLVEVNAFLNASRPVWGRERW